MMIKYSGFYKGISTGMSLLESHNAAVHFVSQVPSCAFSWMVYDSQSKVSLAHNQHRVHPASSTRKLFILFAALKLVQDGGLWLEHVVTVTPGIPSSQYCGALWALDETKSFTLRELLRLMICLSDNVATYYVVNLIGLERLNHICFSYGFSHTTHISSLPLPGINQAHSLDVVNRTTCSDCCGVLKNLVLGPAPDCPKMSFLLSSELRAFAAEILEFQQDSTAIRAWLPNEAGVGDKEGLGHRNYNNVGFYRSAKGYLIMSFVVDCLNEMPGDFPSLAFARDFVSRFALSLANAFNRKV